MKISATKIYSLLCAIMLATLAGCVKNEFNISFDFPKDYQGNYILTYYAWNAKEGRWIENTASIQEGVASVGCVTHNPTLVFISDASSPSNSIALYAERGDNLVISGKSSDMNSWSVAGNKVSEEWSALRNKISKNDTTGKEKIRLIEDFVKAHPSDKLSPILMLTEWNRAEDSDGFIRLWNSIDKNVRSHDIAKMCGCPDLLGVEFTVKADGSLARAQKPALKSLILRSRDNGVDSLHFNKTKATLLCFFTNNDNQRRQTVDSLKALVKLYPDSVKHIIADISVDTDSMTWISSIRTDSLKGVVRGWMPRGIADSDMVSLGVTRVPWYIVKAGSGAEKYAGSDLALAISAFRKEMDTKDKAKKDKIKTKAEKKEPSKK